MDIVLVTGAGGLIGAETVRFFSDKKYKVVGIDNDMRKVFFGDEASTKWQIEELKEKYQQFEHIEKDIRDAEEIKKIFSRYGKDIKLVIHTAAQPSHDWAAKDPFMDFTVNANGTLVLLEMTKKYAENAVFIFTSTNKVYGDTPNKLPLLEKESRWELENTHQYYKSGINESMSIDQTKHSLFGASKVAADILVQEYGRYFNMKTAVFRGGCLTGPGHSGAELHGFLSYLMKCTVTGKKYSIFGYKGKQVRDNIHSSDLVNMFWEFFKNPRVAEVYNAGGSRHSNCSMLEAIKICEEISSKKLDYTYMESNRSGDHIWWISDVNKFRTHYPDWNYQYDINDIFKEIYVGITKRIN